MNRQSMFDEQLNDVQSDDEKLFERKNIVSTQREEKTQTFRISMKTHNSLNQSDSITTNKQTDIEHQM